MKLLVVVDMQNDFITGALGTKEAVAIVPKVRAKIDACRRLGYGIVFTRDSHFDAYLTTQEGRKLTVPHCIWGSDGWQIASSLPVEDSLIFDKPSFGSMELGAYIKNLPDVESVELIGLCTDICVITNALYIKTLLPELPLSVDADCCAGVTPQSHQNALSAMAMCQIDILGK